MQTATVISQDYSAGEDKQYQPPHKELLQESLWLGLCFSHISFTATRQKGERGSESPEVIIESKQAQSWIYQANSAALAAGLEAGMALNAAYILCHDLKVTPRDRFAELDQLKTYTRALAQFTPKLVLRRTDIILLEVRHSLRLFGGFRALLAQLRQVMLDVDICISCAPLAEVAELMASNKISKRVSRREKLQSALGEIRLSQTAIPEKLVPSLERCGLYCLRDLWRLPRADLARRFGPDLLGYLDQLSGQRELPQPYYEAAHYFRVGYDFEQETHSSVFLLHAAESLLGRAQSYLQCRAVLSETIYFRFVYTFRRGAPRPGHLLAVHASQGGDCVADFLPQLDEKLQQIHLKNAVIRLELQIDCFKPRQDSTRDLFTSSRQSTETWGMLLDILMARLGRARVYHLEIWADHRPELAWKKNSPGKNIEYARSKQLQALRPVWLFAEPLPIAIQAYTCLSGSERIETGWWQGEDIRREYYQALSPSDQRCWLYRDLRPQQEQWYMHGLFA